MRRSWLVVGPLLLSLALPASPAPATATATATDTLRLPTPEAARVQQDRLITAVGGRPDRLLASDVPGAVINDEVIRVGLGSDGGVASVLADQRLQLTGEGDYAIRERGPARAATSLSTEPPPVTRRGAVVWQGFSPGRRDLAAQLTLDPQLESTRLPLRITVSTGGRPLDQGGRIPGSGVVTVTLTNATAQPADLPTAADVSATALAGPLDKALAAARRPSAGRLPTTGAGLPRSLPVRGPAITAATQAVPLRLTGALKVDGAKASFRGPTMTTDGTFAGTLGGSRAGAGASVTFTAEVDGPGRLLLDLTAVAALNLTELTPPGGFHDWASWADAGPSQQARRTALDLLVAVAATGARASSYGPYLGADLQGTGSTTFRYAFAPVAATKAARPGLRPRWWAIAVVGLLVLLALGGAAALWRRS